MNYFRFVRMLLHRRLRGRVHHPGLVELRRPRHQPGSGPDPVLKSPHPARRDPHMGKMLPEDRKELYSRWEVTIGYANHFYIRIRDRCDKEGFAGSPTTFDGKFVPCKLNLCWGFIVQVYVVIFPSTLFVQKKDLEVRTTRVRVPDPYQSNPITQLWYWMLILQLLGLNDFLTPLVMALLVGDTLPEMDNGTRQPEIRIHHCQLPSKQQCYLNRWQQCQEFPSCIRIKGCSCPMLLKFTALMGTDESDMAGTPAKV